MKPLTAATSRGAADVLLPDVNVLIYAFRSDADRHEDYKHWLEDAVNGPGAFGISPQVLSSFVRICTHSRIFVRNRQTSYLYQPFLYNPPA